MILWLWFATFYIFLSIFLVSSKFRQVLSSIHIQSEHFSIIANQSSIKGSHFSEKWSLLPCINRYSRVNTAFGDNLLLVYFLVSHILHEFCTNGREFAEVESGQAPLFLDQNSAISIPKYATVCLFIFIKDIDTKNHT